MSNSTRQSQSRLSAIRSKIVRAKLARGEKLTEFEILCDQLGGPAPLTQQIGHAIERGIMPIDTLAGPCREFDFARVWGIYREWQPDEVAARRHWPWVAFAASDYRFEREARRKYDNELKPTKTKVLLDRIAANSKKIADDMALLQTLAARVNDPRAPNRRTHLSWLNEHLSQSLVFGATELDEDPEVMMVAEFGRDNFCIQLAALEKAAAAAARRISPELLTQKPGLKDFGLVNLARRASLVWESLTGRPASVHKVRPRPIDHPLHANDDRSDFVLFVTGTARMAVGCEPTSGQIESALTP